MYLSCVMDTLVCPRRSAPIRSDSPPPSIRWRRSYENCALSHRPPPTPSLTCRHCLLKLFGSRQVPAVDGKIIGCSPYERTTAARVQCVDRELGQGQGPPTGCGLGFFRAGQAMARCAHHLAVYGQSARGGIEVTPLQTE